MSGKMIQRKKQSSGSSVRTTSVFAKRGVAAYLRSRSVSLLAAAAAMAFPVATARAGGPIQVANVASGTAAFAQAGSVTTITAANNTIINYQKFGIPHGNTVDFIQPSASARVLNRILGPAPTQINGTLNANGVVYFVNPAGVMFGAGAVVNVGQLYAAAGHMSDGDFLSGVNAFTDNHGAITNAGMIKAGDVTFAAGNISNNGTILTPEGMVVMAAGKDVYVSKLGSPFLVQVAGTSPIKASGSQISNSGKIDASGGDVAIRAGDMYSLAINTSGTIKAANISIQAAGTDSTVLVSGKIDASNQGANSTGGSITVNGGKIGIGVTADVAGNYGNAPATLSAQGTHGGGKILIGVKPDAASATGYSDASAYDFIGTNAVLNASSTGSGNGGLVDTSGQVLNISPGAVILAAGAGGGEAGQWLLDPLNVTISTAADSNTSNTGSNPVKFKPTATGANVNTGTLDSALAANTGVVVDATGSSGSQLGDITVSNPINPTLTAGTTLTLEAANGIDVEAGIAPASGSAVGAILAVTLQAAGNLTSGSGSGSAIYVNAPINTNGGDFSATAGGSTSLLVTLNSALTATNASSNNGGAVSITSSGTVNITSAGSINVGGFTSSSQGGGNAGSITISGTNGVTISGNLTATGGNSTASGSTGGPGGGILVSSSGGNISLGTVTLDTSGGSDGGTNGGGGGGVGINATGAGPISLDGTTITTSSTGAAGGGAVAIYSGGGAVTLNATNINTTGSGGGAISINTAGNVIFDGANSLSSTGAGTIGGGGGSITGSGSSLVVGGGAGNGGGGNGGGISGGAASLGSTTNSATGTGAQNGSGILTLTAGGGGYSITVNGPLNGITGPTTFASQTVNLNAIVSATAALNGSGVTTVAVGVSGSNQGDIQQGVSLLSSGGTLNLSALSGKTSLDNVIFAIPIVVQGPTTGAVTAASWTTSVNTAAITISGDLSASATTGNGFDFSGTTTVSSVATFSSPNSGQIFGGTVALGANSLTLMGTNLNTSPSGGAAFTGSTGSSLTLNFSGGANLGTISGLAALDGIGTGTYTLNSDITTTAGQTYDGTVNLNASAITLAGTTLAGPPTGVVFNGATDTLTLNFNNSATLAAITVGTLDGTGTGGYTINGNITTTGSQTYTGAVTLNASAITLTANNGSTAQTITFDSAVNGGDTLNIGSAGSITASNAIFDGSVGGTVNLTSLSVSGSTSLGGNVTTTAGQTYLEPVTLTALNITLAGSTLNASPTAGAVFSGAGNTLNLRFSSGANLGAITTLGALNGTGTGTYTLNGNVATSGAQTYDGTATLATDVALSGTTLNASPAAGAVFTGAHALTLDFSSAANLGTIISLGSLDGTGAGGYTLNGSITTTGAQTYDTTATLTSDVILSGTTLNASPAAGAVFNGAGITLSLDFTGSANLGPIAALGILNSTGTGTNTLNGNISTTGAQNYTGAVTLNASPITLTANSSGTVQTITFGTTVDGAGTLNIGSAGASTMSNAVFDGNVGGTANLTALNVSGTTALGGNVTTTGAQNYSGAVTLNASPVTVIANSSSTAQAITFGSTVNGAATLNIGSAGISTVSNAVFDGNIGGATNLTALNVSGTTSLGGNVTTTNGQVYDGTLTLIAANITLADSGVMGIALNSVAATSLQNLTINETGTGTVSLDGTIAMLNNFNITTAGTVTLRGNITANDLSISSSDGGNPISVSGTVTINADTQSYAATGAGASLGSLAGLQLADTLGTAAPQAISLTQNATIQDTDLPALTQFTTGVLTGTSYSITSSDGNIILAGGGLTPVSDANLLLSAPHGNISLGTAGGFIISALTATSATAGAITLNGNVTTTNGQTYNSAVTVGGGATLTTTNSAVSFASTVDSATGIAEALAVNAGTGTVTFAGAVGVTNPLASLTVSSPSIINGGAVKTTGGQSYLSSMTLGANTTLTDPISIDFANTVTGPFSLTLADSSGTSTLGGAVATNVLNVTAGTIGLQGGMVTTSNGQSYNGAVTLGANTTLTDPTSIDFAGAVSGAVFSLTLADSGGTSTLGGAVTTDRLNVTASTIALNGGTIITAHGQSYTGALTLGANATLTDPLSITFLSTVSGPGFSLTLSDSGGTSTLDGALNTNALNISAGAIALNGATVNTANNQSYTGAVTLGSDTTLTTSNNGAVNLSSTVNAATAGAQTLAINAGSGTATFGGAVGGTNALASLTVSSPSVINGGAVTTLGEQSYAGPTILGADTTLTTTNSAVTFSSSVDAATTGAEGLTLDAGSGTVTFGGPVGGTNSLATLTVTGPTAINGGVVTTTGGQSYDNAVTLGADSTLTTSNSAVNFASTVDSAAPGAETLTINAGTGNVTFGGAAGQSHALANLTVTGLTQINGGTVTTNGGQTYNGAVTLGSDVSLTGATLNNASVPAIFSGNGDRLTLQFSSNADLGTITALGSLVANGSGTTALYGDITTSGAQSYTGIVALADTPITLTGTTLNGSAIPAAFSGSGDSLALNFSSSVDLGTITALGSLASNGSGTTTLHGNITTGTAGGGTGAQSYNGSVTLSTASITLTGTTLNAASSPAVFAGSGASLILNFSSSASLGAITSLGALDGTGIGTYTLHGNVTTAGNQTYAGNVTLADTGTAIAYTLLAGGDTVAFGGVVNGTTPGDDSLNIGIAGNSTNASFGAAVGGATPLAALTVAGIASVNANITTSGGQVYGEAVTLTNSAAFTGSTLNASPAGGAIFGGAGQTLTLNFSGGENLGTITTLGSLTGSGVGVYSLNGNISTSGAQSYNGTVVLHASTVTLTGTSLNSASVPAAFSGTNDALVLDFSGSANLGATATLGSLADEGSGTTTLYGNITTSGNQSYNTPVGVNSSLTLAGASLNPSPTAVAVFLGNAAPAPALTLDFSQSYNVNLGASNGLGSLDLGVSSSVPVNILTSTTLGYPLTVAGTVAVGQSSDPAGTVITLSGPAFKFGSSFDAASPNDAVVFAASAGAASSVEFDGVVGGSSTNPDLASLTVQGTALVNGGAVNTVGGQVYDGAVTINTGGTATFTSTQGGIAEDGGINNTTGSITLSPGSALMVPNPDPILGAGTTTGDFRPQHYLTINGNITASETVTLAPNAPTFTSVSNPVPDAATIITTVQSGTVTVAGQNITMGQNQKWTSLTSLTLDANAAGGADVATIGDLNVAGTLTVRANTIDMLLRPAGSQLVPGISSGVLGLHVNAPGSEGVDIVANSLNFTGSLVPVGAAADFAPQFAYGPGGTVTGSITPNSPGVHYYGVNVVPSALMASGIADGRLTTYYLDLKASGPSTSNVTVAVAPIIPPPPPQFNSIVVLSSEQRQILREAGINARNTSIDNLLNLFGGKAVFNDIPTSDGMIIVHPTLLDYYVTTSRLPYQQTREFIAMYRQVFLAPVINPKTHQPELDKKGNVVYRSRRMELHGLFRNSFNDYSKTVGAAHATALGFRGWLEKTPSHTQALQTLNALRTLLRQVRGLGLTSVELRLSHSTILAELNPAALSERQFEEAVMGRRLSKL